VLVVDDAPLLAVLAVVAADDVHATADRNEVFTTGCWYWRLSRALHDGTVTGALSRTMQDLNAEQQTRVVGAVSNLPRQIGLLSLRQLVPVMTALETGRRLLVLKVGPKGVFADLAPTEAEALEAIGGAATADELIYLLRAFLEADAEMRRSPYPRVELEIAAVVLTTSVEAPSQSPSTDWIVEVVLSREGLPPALRAVLRELGEQELRLPAELRIRRRS